MLSDQESFILKELASAYGVYKKYHGNWMQDRGTQVLGGIAAELMLDRCGTIDGMKRILNMIAKGIAEKQPDAIKSSEMFDELFKADEAMQKNLQTAYSNSMLPILQKQPLKIGLQQALNDFESVNNMFKEITSDYQFSQQPTSTNFFSNRK